MNILIKFRSKYMGKKESKRKKINKKKTIHKLYKKNIVNVTWTIFVQSVYIKMDKLTRIKRYEKCFI